MKIVCCILILTISFYPDFVELSSQGDSPPRIPQPKKLILRLRKNPSSESSQHAAWELVSSHRDEEPFANNSSRSAEKSMSELNLHDNSSHPLGSRLPQRIQASSSQPSSSQRSRPAAQSPLELASQNDRSRSRSRSDQPSRQQSRPSDRSVLQLGSQGESSTVFRRPRSRSPQRNQPSLSQQSRPADQSVLESSSQSDQAFSSSGPRSLTPATSRSLPPENEIPSSLRNPLKWVDFQFPANCKLLYYRRIPERYIFDFQPIPSYWKHPVLVNDNGDVFRFKDGGGVKKVFSAPFVEATVNINGIHEKRSLTEEEIKFLDDFYPVESSVYHGNLVNLVLYGTNITRPN